MATEEKTTINLRNIPKKLKVEFQLYCVKNGNTMKSTIVNLMHQAIEEEKIDSKQKNLIDFD